MAQFELNLKPFGQSHFSPSVFKLAFLYYMERVPADETRITKTLFNLQKKFKWPEISIKSSFVWKTVITPKTVSPDTLIPQRWLEKQVHSFFLYPKTLLLFFRCIMFSSWKKRKFEWKTTDYLTKEDQRDRWLQAWHCFLPQNMNN